MDRKRQSEQQWIEPGQSSVRRPIPYPFPTGSLPTRRDERLSATHQRRRVTPRGGATSAPELRGLYIISVAARLLEMHPQTLRKYERVGLVCPSRTVGMLRLYSQEDISQLRLIKHLVDDLGMNLAGVEFVLSLFNRLQETRVRIAALEEERQLKDSVGKEFEKLLEILDVAFADPEQG